MLSRRLCRAFALVAAAATSALSTAAARGQTCGTWLAGPPTPDLPAGAQVADLAATGGALYAVVASTGASEVWRYTAADEWTDMAWSTAEWGAPQALTVRDGHPAVCTAVVIGTQGDFNIWDIAVREHDGASWQVVASGTQLLQRQTLEVNQVNLGLRDLAHFGGQWHVIGGLSRSSPPFSIVTSGVLYRFSPAIEVLASSETAGCTFCLNPRGFHDLEVYNGALYVGGSFATVFFGGGSSIAAANIARWSGAAWQAVGAGTNAPVRGMAAIPSVAVDSPLAVWGDFTQAGGGPAEHIAAYNGITSQWSPLGAGVVGTAQNSLGAPVAALPIGGSGGPGDVDILVAGVSAAGGAAVDGFARWTGSAWQEFGDPGVQGIMYDAAVLGGQVVAGGSGLSTAGSPLFGVGRWDGVRWAYLSSQGTDGAVRAMHTSGSDVYAGGEFTRMDGVAALRIARRDGPGGAGGWSALGSGVDGPVRAIATFAGETVAAGSFANAGGVAAANIAAWNGSSWRALGAGLNGAVRGLTVWNGQLVAVGDFTASGAAPMMGAAKWNGSAWSAVDPAFTLTGINAAAVLNNELYIGGNEPCDVRRLTGGAFQVIGNGVTGNVHALAALAGSLYVGGEFFFVGGNLQHRLIARWTGSQWLGVGQGPSDFGFGAVLSITPAVTQLLVGGDFQVTTPSGPVQRAARWNGASWLALPTGSPDGVVYAGAQQGSRLLVGGGFTAVGETVSAFIAEWTPSPVIFEGPEPVTVCADDGTGMATFRIDAAEQAGQTYRWRRNGTPIFDDLRITGADTPELTIFAVIPSDAGEYTCAVTDACTASVTSPGAALVVGGCCPADWNDDGQVNSSDISAFLTAWLQSVQGGGLAADFNGDMAVNSTDISAFLTAWLQAVSGGC